MRILKYDVVVGGPLNTLREEMEKRIEAGWQPIGGIQTDNGGVFYQAVVFTDEEERRQAEKQESVRREAESLKGLKETLKEGERLEKHIVDMENKTDD